MAAPNGLGVPFTFSSLGYPQACVGMQCLHDSIFTILSTFPGERVMRPDFGSYLRMYLFEPLTRATGYQARAEVFRAIAAWEPRVIVQDVLFTLDTSTLTLNVTWRSNGTQLAVTSLTLPRNGA
jgi:Bacteriophage baseplate protein W